jgi:protein-glutamine gamma-glutamyltransferase
MRWRSFILAILVAEAAAAKLPGLDGVLAALAIAVAAHFAMLPAWVLLLLVAAIAWRWTADLRHWRLPPAWLRGIAAAAVLLVVLAAYRTVNGIEAGTAFLVLTAALKLLEARAPRDLTVLVFIAWFLLYAALLRDQRLPLLPYLLAGTLFATGALMRVHAGPVAGTWRDVLRGTTTLMLQALPLVLALFLLFPRLPGPFWGLAAPGSARSGLSDEMMPGDVSDLSVSGAPAFRVRFAGSPPPPALRYWRGPVLHEFDGRAWRRPRGQAFPDQVVTTSGAPVDYQLTLEPHDRNWILALDMAGGWLAQEAYRSFDFTLLSPRPLTDVASFQLRSYPHYHAGTTLPLTLRRKDTQLPSSGNPRAVALGRELRARYGDPQEITRAMLRLFRNQPFVYTLEPPRLSGDAVDEFLFGTRKGFCEHYASAFTVVMRAAGVPARVVTGYQGGEMNPIGGYLLVRQSDAHAWSEIWLDDRGWVRVDPTAAVAPERIERGLVSAVGADEPVPGRFRQQSELWLQLTLRWDAVNDFWNERVVRFNAARQFELLERLGIDEPDWRTLGLGLAASLAAFFVALSAYLAWTSREPARDWPARLHGEVVRRLHRREIVPGYAEGPVEFLDRAAAACPDLAGDIEKIRDVYSALRYGPRPSAAELSRLKHLVNRLRP